MEVPHTFRPVGGQVLTGVVAALGLVLLVVTAWSDGVLPALRTAPATLLVVGAVWALFWRPYVRVDDGGVELGNVLRTIRVPWPALTEVDTQYALTLRARTGTGGERKFTAWAAPASGRRTAKATTPEDLRESGVGGSARPGDATHTLSGRAAGLVRRTWASWQAQGSAQQGSGQGSAHGSALEGSAQPAEPESRWHLGVLGGGAVLVALTVLVPQLPA